MIGPVALSTSKKSIKATSPRRWLLTIVFASIVALTVGSFTGGWAVGNGGTLPVPLVNPPMIDESLSPGGATSTEKWILTPEIPPLVDIFLLEDETGSFINDIANLQALAPNIWDAIALTGTDFTMGVGGYRDFAQNPYGLSGDWVYRLVQDLTATKADFTAGVGNLTAVSGAGNDGPEAQLEALHYAVTPGHAAIDSNADGDTTDTIDTAAGLQPTWRSGAARVILLTTDNSCHVTGDAGGWPGDAGTDSATTTASLAAAAGVTVIGLVPGGAGSNSCIDTLAAGTGGTVHATTATGSAIKDAILAGLGNLPITVVPNVIDCGPLSVTFDPTSITVTSGDSAHFLETVTVPVGTPPGDIHCEVVFTDGDGNPLFVNSAGEPISVQEIWITVGGEGCTPGFWKNHIDAWVDFGTEDDYGDTFIVIPTFDAETLLETLRQGGGGEKALGRHAVAALLNASSPEVSYDLSVAGVIALVQSAYSSGDFEAAKGTLEAFNEQGCPTNGKPDAESSSAGGDSPGKSGGKGRGK